jgi:hypothetical protein
MQVAHSVSELNQVGAVGQKGAFPFNFKRFALKAVARLAR